MQQANLVEAIDVFRALVAVDSTNAAAFYNLGLALKQHDEFAAAETELRRAMSLDRSLPEPPFTLGVVLWQTARPEEAIDQFREAIRRKPDYADAHYMLATVLKQRGSFDEALDEFRQAIRYQPLSADAHLSLGQLLEQRGQSGSAELAEAARLKQKMADAQRSTFAVAVGMQKLKVRDYTGAIVHLREAVRLAADNPQAHYQLAVALQHTGARAEARTHFTEAQRLSPRLMLSSDLR
jgi:protein O-GlcNAc transferase